MLVAAPFALFPLIRDFANQVEPVHFRSSLSLNATGHCSVAGGAIDIDIATLRISSGETTEKLLQTDALEYGAVISPNGRWMAFRSQEPQTLGSQIYVRPFPDAAHSSQRLIGPGEDPLWGPEGRELFYRTFDGVMVVDVNTGDTFERGTPRPLFPDRYHFTLSRNWDLAPDGRFLMITQGGAPTASPEIVVVENWFEELTRLVPVP